MQKLVRTLLFVTALLGCISFAYADNIKFPALTGRVVDNAHMLSANTISRITAELQAQEDKTGEQVVIVTLPSLQGQTIENYGYQLGRHWGIGQKGKDTGVLLIVAPNERKVRIEVGYGLEGTLTDAISSQIIYGIILPDFRQGQMEMGINEGLNGILNTLNGLPLNSTPVAMQQQISSQQQQDWWGGFSALLLLFWLIFNIWRGSTGRTVFIGGFLGGGGFSSGGGGFGGFSGGGGSFGGGGCSGGW